MSTLLLTIFGSTLGKIAFWLLETFVAKKNQEAESRKIFLQLAQVLRTAGVKGVRSRYEAEGQIGDGESEWDEREKPNA